MASTSKQELSMELKIDQFITVTGADDEIAQRMLEACNGDLEMAINMHVDGIDAVPGGPSPPSTISEESGSTPSLPVIPNDDDNVRPPILPTQEILVENYSFGFRGKRRTTRSVFDGFRNFQVETQRQEEAMLNSGNSTNNHKLKTLEDLFRPPLDIMHKGSFESAREAGQIENKWLLVNIQNIQEFSCQVLNRDLWSNQGVKNIIKEHFIFWQTYHDSEEGERYLQFYKVIEWPYIAVLDPRTGENLITWTSLDTTTFGDIVTEFLTEHRTLDGSDFVPPKKIRLSDSIIDASEASQIEAAIRASMCQTEDSSSRSSSSCSLGDCASEERSNSPCVMSNRPATTTSSSSSSTNLQLKETTLPTHNNLETESSQENFTWKEFLGDVNGAQSDLMLRFPDGNKEQFCLPASSKLKALVLYVQSKGFSNEQFELVTNFPRRRISSLDLSMDLKEAKLYPQETVFVQSR